MTWTDVCHKCGKKIFNGAPEDRDRHEYIEEMKSMGFLLGYNTKTVGYYGNTRTENIKPICSECSNNEIKTQHAKIVKKEINKIVPELKKVYMCPFCRGYSDRVYTSPNKNDVVEHIKEIHYIELLSGSDY